MAMLVRGEVDLAYLLDAPQAEEVKRDPTLKPASPAGLGPSSWMSSASGTPSHPGTTGGCGWPPTTWSTGGR